MESGAATRGKKARAKGGQAPKVVRASGGKRTTEVDTAALNRRRVAAGTAISASGSPCPGTAPWRDRGGFQRGGRRPDLTGEPLARGGGWLGRAGSDSGWRRGPARAPGDRDRQLDALVDDLVPPFPRSAGSAGGDCVWSCGRRCRTGSGTLRGQFLKVGRTVNNLVDQLSTFTDEARVASEVGTEGRAWWAGPSAWYVGFVAGSHGLRQHDGVPAHRSGAGYRTGYDGGREG
ncbi:hypothetical protein SVIOM74S_05122 [Streptomyces violarus]